MSAYGFGLNTSAKSANFNFVPFMQVPLKLYQLLTRDSTALLSFLMNWQKVVSTQYRLIDGNFYVTREKLEDELHLALDLQRKLFRRLQRIGFVRAKLSQGRWQVRIKYKSIQEAIDSLE
jgi:hypothetical protein